MDHFFKPLRRKLGVLVMLLACLVAGIWARGFAVQDLCLSGDGQRVVTRGSRFHVFSNSARDGFVWAAREAPGMSWLAGWQVRPVQGEDYFDPLGVSDDVMKPKFRRFHWWFAGIEAGDYRYEIHDQYGNYDYFSFWRIPHAAVVIPLILIAVWLMRPIRGTRAEKARVEISSRVHR